MARRRKPGGLRFHCTAPRHPLKRLMATNGSLPAPAPTSSVQTRQATVRCTSVPRCIVTDVPQTCLYCLVVTRSQTDDQVGLTTRHTNSRVTWFPSLPAPPLVEDRQYVPWETSGLEKPVTGRANCGNK